MNPVFTFFSVIQLLSVLLYENHICHKGLCDSGLGKTICRLSMQSPVYLHGSYQILHEKTFEVRKT